MNRLTTGERIVLFASGALVILSFIPLWASVSIPALGTENFSAWGGYGVVVKLALLCALVAAGLAIARAAGASLALPPITYVALGGVATLLMLLGVLAGPDDGGAPADLLRLAQIDVSRGILLFVGVVLAAAIAYGGYMHMTEEGTARPLGGPSSPPAPPPA